MSDATRLLAFLGSPFLERRAEIWVPEAAHALRPDLYQRLFEGTYDRPFLVDISDERLLCFALDGSVQTAMDLRDPYALVSDYTRKMMGFLLLQPQPRRIVMVGLGGGALAKYCYRHLQDSYITVFEIDPDVIALRDRFEIPQDDHRFQVILGDGAEYMARQDMWADVILVDAFDRSGLAPSVMTPKFFADARARLGADGVFVMNLAASRDVCRVCIERVRTVFGEPVLAVPIPWDRTTVVFAFERMPSSDRRRVPETACLGSPEMLGLSFPRLQRRLRKSMRRYVRSSRSCAAGEVAGSIDRDVAKDC